eukprot:CAMPEP_0113967012 /NCGR_PEP_ID=MMETSP0011_2-20120614/8650_1 /TAXON_ID=101924 /ORGANISM="Rhodosorus marinus" /LENGTH=315 /DNA_ID=CAMNT_0000979761 /DNA_START=255 /DNA_END=1202 /DNA_ORIENTATION=- /assembly_acc=CAM_ASM_000156
MGFVGLFPGSVKERRRCSGDRTLVLMSSRSLKREAIRVGFEFAGSVGFMAVASSVSAPNILAGLLLFGSSAVTKAHILPGVSSAYVTADLATPSRREGLLRIAAQYIAATVVCAAGLAPIRPPTLTLKTVVYCSLLTIVICGSTLGRPRSNRNLPSTMLALSAFFPYFPSSAAILAAGLENGWTRTALATLILPQFIGLLCGFVYAQRKSPTMLTIRERVSAHQKSLKSYGLAGLIAYGVMNILYYSIMLAVVLSSHNQQELTSKSLASAWVMIWTGSQVTKPARFALAVGSAPFIQTQLIRFGVVKDELVENEE